MAANKIKTPQGIGNKLFQLPSSDTSDQLAYTSAALGSVVRAITVFEGAATRVITVKVDDGTNVRKIGQVTILNGDISKNLLASLPLPEDSNGNKILELKDANWKVQISGDSVAQTNDGFVAAQDF